MSSVLGSSIRGFVLAGAVFFIGCGSSSQPATVLSTLTGQVVSGFVPVAGGTVSLYLAGAARRSGAVQLGASAADVNGVFEIDYAPPADPQAVLYVIASAPSADLVFAAVLGHGPFPTAVVVNERTTVATACAMAQFIEGTQIGGPYPGVQSAAATAHNLADIGNGNVAALLAGPENGITTSTMARFNTLANLVSACVGDPATCAAVFAAATPPGGTLPQDTLEAAVDIAHFPGNNVAGLWALAQGVTTYLPSLQVAPTDWTLSLRYVGPGNFFDGPGNLAFDADGNAWINNNYQFSLDPLAPDLCGDDHVIKLAPNGQNCPGSPYQGGGLYGAGFGIAIDKQGNVWIGNFGFQGTGCGEDLDALSKSVSVFSPQGVAISPGRIFGVSPGGFFTDDPGQPQGMTTDQQGAIWVANHCAGSVTKFPTTDPALASTFSPATLELPFDVAIDTGGNCWVTSNQNNIVFQLDPNGSVLNTVSGSGTPGDIFAPMGIASDSLGNVWVANSGGVNTPCGTFPGPDMETRLASLPVDGFAGASVTMIDSSGSKTTFPKGALFVPWGIAIDGNDNVWMGNFGAQRIVHICGAKPGACPGFAVGDQVSPSTGYTSDALVRITGIQVDPAGNVWCTNNWRLIPNQTNPGGHAMVVFVGIAEPVRTPLLGTPRRLE